jgi:hypothetical protein
MQLRHLADLMWKTYVIYHQFGVEARRSQMLQAVCCQAAVLCDSAGIKPTVDDIRVEAVTDNQCTCTIC